MSKMYEALQQAKGERTAFHQPDLVDTEQASLGGRLGLETEMSGLYRSLDNIFPGLDRKVILFLGAKGGEGTSTVVSSLARVAAEQLGRKVAVLDADTLHPTQHRLFGVSPRVGWDDVLRGAEPAENAIYRTNENSICVVPVSSAKAGTVQAIDTRGTDDLIRALRERFDLVLIDCAAASLSPDSIALSRKVDGVVLVIEAESTRWPVAESVCQQFAKAGGRVVGIVLNKRRYYIPDFFYRKL